MKRGRPRGKPGTNRWAIENGQHLWGISNKNNANGEALCLMAKNVICVFGQPRRYSSKFQFEKVFVWSVTG